MFAYRAQLHISKCKQIIIPTNTFHIQKMLMLRQSSGKKKKVAGKWKPRDWYNNKLRHIELTLACKRFIVPFVDVEKGINCWKHKIMSMLGKSLIRKPPRILSTSSSSVSSSTLSLSSFFSHICGTFNKYARPMALKQIPFYECIHIYLVAFGGLTRN